MFKKGQSGNPNGAPKKKHSITATIREMMDEEPEIKKSLAKRILAMAAKGDIIAIKTIWSYLDGMPAQDLNLAGKIEQIIISREPRREAK